MALHIPSIRNPTATPHIPGWMVGVVGLVAVLIISIAVLSRPGEAPTTAQTVGIAQSNPATQAYLQFRSGERDALNTQETTAQAYQAYRAGEQLTAAEEAALAKTASQAAYQAFRAGERIGPAEEAQAAAQAWLTFRQGER